MVESTPKSKTTSFFIVSALFFEKAVKSGEKNSSSVQPE
jgi:hypothetical protein